MKDIPARRNLALAVSKQASCERIGPLRRQRHLSGYRSRTRTRIVTLYNPKTHRNPNPIFNFNPNPNPKNKRK